MNTQSNINVSFWLLPELIKKHPKLSFIDGQSFYWSPKDQTIHYNLGKLSSVEGSWSLIHELAHGLLGHASYKTDYELLSYEVAAWQKALEIAEQYKLSIEPAHIEECLDSYRNWLYARSTCPTCKLNSLQTSPDTYKCMNCLCKWTVSPSRFCRPYRKMVDRRWKLENSILETKTPLTA